jgi:predicted O-methyltransferase YrrM
MNILTKIFELTNEQLNSLDTAYIKDYDVGHDPSYFHLPGGREHYRLLMYFSSLYDNKTLFDVGTNRGVSAIALSHNKNNKVKTYDVTKVLEKYPSIDNVEFIVGDSLNDKDLLSSPFIFLDVNHDGEYENKFYEFLVENEWKGILLLDDIHLNTPMKSFWERIVERKFDLTDKGHWSGTGLVIFE